VTSHVFADTTHVVQAPHTFACVVISATYLYTVMKVAFKRWWSWRVWSTSL